VGVKTLNAAYRSASARAHDVRLCAVPPRSAHRRPRIRAVHALDPRAGANIQFHVQPLSLDKFGDPLHSFRLHRERVQSAAHQPRLCARLRSADPADKPVIKPNYLSTDEDRRVASIRSALPAGS
jgi:choline dehydrogenase-like flavoprotein